MTTTEHFTPEPAIKLDRRHEGRRVVAELERLGYVAPVPEPVAPRTARTVLVDGFEYTSTAPDRSALGHYERQLQLAQELDFECECGRRCTC